ncbi:unnamed protein product [Rhizophagus irregularis]|nr:unnamed protein product [Rhizophagus irregularis]CAB5373143.1 unnamed protein product [Rhizophagus irregularis]
MASSLSINSNPQARKDEAIDLLGDSIYATISFMHQALQIIKQDICSLTKESVNIVLTILDIVFDKDVEYVDSSEDEINTSHLKRRKFILKHHKIVKI